MALGRVLTLLIVADESDADEAIEAANDASRQHPCRIIVDRRPATGAARAGWTPRSGSAATPGPARWSCCACTAPSPTTATASSSRCCCRTPRSSPGGRGDAPADVSADPIGAMAQRRITDAAEAAQPARRCSAGRRPTGPATPTWPGPGSPSGAACSRRRSTSRRTSRSPSATVTGGSDSPSTDLLAGWLALTLRCPVTRARTRAGTGMVSVRLERRSGDIDLVRPDGVVATLAQPGQPDAGSPCRGGSSRSASPTSCAGWTPTRSTPSPSPGGCPRSAPAGR